MILRATRDSKSFPPEELILLYGFNNFSFYSLRHLFGLPDDPFKYSLYSSDFRGEHISDFLPRFAFVVIEIDQLYNIFETRIAGIFVLKHKDICCNY